MTRNVPRENIHTMKGIRRMCMRDRKFMKYLDRCLDRRTFLAGITSLKAAVCPCMLAPP